jgi:hypothetical protein
MCDYSLHAVATRPAEVAETLVSTKFRGSVTRGFASPNDPQVAVCLRPGTEIAFEKDAQTGGMVLRKNIGDRLARFRQIDTEKSLHHHDALEFSNGTSVLVTDLVPGQKKASGVPTCPPTPDGQNGPGAIRGLTSLNDDIRVSSIKVSISRAVLKPSEASSATKNVCLCRVPDSN